MRTALCSADIPEHVATAFAEADALGWLAAGTTSPNPPVGCVLVDGAGAVVGSGYTQPPGGPHAEIMALRSLPARPRAATGLTAYVTLEPCNHTGRTGPCAQALIDAGIAEVHYLFADPHPTARGGGQRLREAGLSVHGPYLELSDDPTEEFSGLEWAPICSVETWLRAQQLGRPHVTLKMATTADGYVAAEDGSSQWITGPQARAVVHADRARRDAILVSTGTVVADNPRLTARRSAAPGAGAAEADPSAAAEGAEHGAGSPSGGSSEFYAHQPLRVVVGNRDVARGTERPAIFDPPGEALHIRSRDLHRVLAELGERGIIDVLIEGGPALSGAAIRAGLVDCLQAYIAPALLGSGLAATRVLDTSAEGGPGTMAEIRRLTPRSISPVGRDVLFTSSRAHVRRAPAIPPG